MRSELSFAEVKFKFRGCETLERERWSMLRKAAGIGSADSGDRGVPLVGVSQEVESPVGTPMLSSNETSLFTSKQLDAHSIHDTVSESLATIPSMG